MLAMLILLQTGCKSKSADENQWLLEANTEANESVEELYESALKEDTLIVYTVSTRITKVKESFEKDYPGLSIEVRDLRSPDLVDAVWANYKNNGSDCDVVICNDNSGSFYEKLVKTGAVVPYLPSDIKEHMMPECVGEMVTFINEAELLFYNTEKYDSCPIENIWELTLEQYYEKIYIPNPIRSFSTYALFGSILEQSEALEKAYIKLYGHKPDLGDSSSVAELFLSMLSKNAVFTNSSDEVYEALGTTGGKADFGIMVSSKLRMQNYGYSFEPANIEPFYGCKTSFAVMIAAGSKNVSTAKLFIRYLLGEADGAGEGYKPFLTKGTWSARADVENPDETEVDNSRLLIPNQISLSEKRQQNEAFFEKIIKK